MYQIQCIRNYMLGFVGLNLSAVCNEQNLDESTL